MGSVVETLFNLQKLDAELLEKQHQIDEFEERLRLRRGEMAKCQARIDELGAVRKDLVNQRALADRRVSDNRELLKERRQRVSRVRTERELRAGEGEVATLTDEIDEQETQLLELMQQVDDVEKQVETLRQDHRDLAQADHRQVEEEANRIEALKRELASERESRDVVASELDSGIRARYETVLASRAGRAVVKVNGSSCGGCHMQIPAQTVIEILRAGVIHTCPSCQRILYVVEETAEETAE